MSQYRAPTGAELRTLIRLGGLSGEEAGALLDVKGRQVRRWTGEDARMPYSALVALVVHRSGRVLEGPGDWRREIGDLLAGEPGSLYLVELDPERPPMPHGARAPLWGTLDAARTYLKSVASPWSGTASIWALTVGQGEDGEGA